MKVELKNISLIRVELNDQDLSNIERKTLTAFMEVEVNGHTEKRPVETALAKQEEYIRLRTSPEKTKISESKEYFISLSLEGHRSLIFEGGYISTKTGPSAMDTVEMKYKG